MDTTCHFLCTMFVLKFAYGVRTQEGCDSPQYLEIGTKGIIACTFQEGYYGILWYNSKNYITDTSIMHFQESAKGGDGYDSGEFDIHPNGSLIITNVSLEHDHYFTAVKLTELSDDFVPHYIRVFAMVKPDLQHPLIKPCGIDNPVCYLTLWRNASIACTITGSRPAVEIEWFARTVDGDRNITSDINVTHTGVVSTSVARLINPFRYSSLLSLLVCKARSPKEMLTHHESLVIVESKDIDFFSVTSEKKHFQLHSKLELSCTAGNISFLVWKVHRKTMQDPHNIILAAYDGNTITKRVSDGYKLGTNGSLIIPKLGIEHEADYGCIFGNGTHEEMKTFETIVFVPPVPYDVNVRGCPLGERCLLEMDREGNLTCVVNGIRPIVTVAWKAQSYINSTYIMLSEEETKINRNHDDTYNISLTLKYTATLSSQTGFTVKCQVIDKDITPFHFSQYVDVVFLRCTSTLCQDDIVKDTAKNSNYGLIITAVVIAVLLIALFCVILKVKGCPSKRQRSTVDSHQEAVIPMLGINSSTAPMTGDKNTFQQRKSIFVRELKDKYREFCSSINPVPFFRSENRGIENVFVEGGLSFFNTKQRVEKGNTWQPLKSYREIFTDRKMTSNRRIVEGDPGFGKSTLTLQWAYEWLTEDKRSYFKDVDILILLRLRQLGNVISIYEAIKQFLLPKDTQLKVEDIQSVIRNCDSTLVILDGFDEYPIEEVERQSDILLIIKQEILRQHQVILTTRSSCLPKEYASLTKRFRLRGFDDIDRDAYLRKAVVGNNKAAADKIKSKLRENPFLDDICQIPLFFVMFAHLANEEVNITQFKSVTRFFGHIISCFHSHMKNKMKDLNVKQCQLYENDHSELDEEAFLALVGNSKQLMWKKEYITNKLGSDFYKQYERIGILVEEDVLCVNDDLNTSKTDPYIYKTNVRFYHKLFCEWYAAHFLAKYLENPQDKLYLNVTMECVNSNDDDGSKQPSETQVSHEAELLGRIDPYELQYLYRFTCGLSSTAADKVYTHLKRKYGGDKFYILCLLEQSENYDQMERSISQLSSTNITIHENHSRLLQRSTIQLMEIASQRKIKIEQLQLWNSFRSVEFSGNYLLMKSDIRLPILSSLSKLVLSDRTRELNCEDIIGIFNFCWNCSNSIVLQFDFCLLPKKIKTENLWRMKARRIEVLWRTQFSPMYRLNLNTGKWEYQDGGSMSNGDYKNEVLTFRKLQREKNEEDEEIL